VPGPVLLTARLVTTGTGSIVYMAATPTGAKPASRASANQPATPRIANDAMEAAPASQPVTRTSANNVTAKETANRAATQTSARYATVRETANRHVTRTSAKSATAKETAKYVAEILTRSVARVAASPYANKQVMTQSAAQITINRAEHVSVSAVIVLITTRGFIQIKQYTIALEDALASVTRNIRPHLAMMSITAITGFIILLQSVQLWGQRARDHWNVMTQVCLGDVLVASRATIAVPFIILA
jgi:hypothetical protein